MKIGLVVPANIKYSPYVRYYTDILDRENIVYRIMSWDKAGIPESVDMVFSYHTSDFDRKKILFGHLFFSLKCRKYMKKEKPDHLIVFTIAPLFFLGFRYLRKYDGRLLIDVRDDSPFRRRFARKLDKIGRLAHTLVVSSPFYADWFSRRSCLCHNADRSIIEENAAPYGKSMLKRPTCLVFAGMMIEDEVNIRIIRVLANRDDFELVYVGRDNEGKERIKRFVRENNIRNVSFEGEYRKEEIVRIYRGKADIVNILRENTQINRNALPNKLYDAVISGIPIAVFNHNEAIANYVKCFHLGIVLDEQHDIAEQLLDYVQAYDPGLYQSGRNEFLNRVQCDQRQFEEELITFCRG